jgi:hypothetical protein
MWLRFNGSGIFPSICFASGAMLRPTASDATSFFETPNAAPRDDWPPGTARGSIPCPEHQVCAVPNQRPPSREGHRFADDTEALIDAVSDWLAAQHL